MGGVQLMRSTTAVISIGVIDSDLYTYSTKTLGVHESLTFSRLFVLLLLVAHFDVRSVCDVVVPSIMLPYVLKL